MKSFATKNSSNDDGLRGIVLLPTEMEGYQDWKPLLVYLNSNLSIHMSCIKSSGK